MSLSHVVIISDSSTSMGGDSALARLSARQLAARGLRVTYVCGDEGKAPDLEAEGIDVIGAGSARLLQRSRLRAMREGIYNPGMRRFMEAAIAKTDGPGTVYHLHGWAQILSPAIFSALARVASRTYVHAHDMFLACPNGVFMDYQANQACARVPLSWSCIGTHCDKRSYLHKLWRVARQQALFRYFDTDLGWAGIIAIHPDAVPRLARAGYPENLFRVVRNPAAAYTPDRIKAESNNSLVYIGRLERDKGVLDLAKAAQRCGIDLVCIGEGALRDTIEREFPSVRITGWLPPEAIGAEVRSARALVMPSHHPEPFALVLPEAIASGLPVAVAKSALMASEIEDAGLGMAFDVFDDADFDRAITFFRDMNESDLETMSKRCLINGGNLALTVSEWVDALVDLYEEALCPISG